MGHIPKRYLKFKEEFPEAAKLYETLGTAVHAAGPLDNRSRALVKFAISVGARLEGGAHSHIRKALETGVKAEELKHVALLAIPTIGLPSAMAAMSWIDDILESTPSR
ncbi:MAG: carboxymuconolactone decarboxylase family protein [Ignavibacteria bacterium]|nr:carboxymuconolactone decarboxylase family protein [Ignavibacteria bacterium]